MISIELEFGGKKPGAPREKQMEQGKNQNKINAHKAQGQN